VKTLTGKQISLTVHVNDAVDELKALIEEMEGIPMAQQRLVYEGVMLQDTDMLATRRIGDNAVLHLVLALRGGLCACATLSASGCECALTVESRSCLRLFGWK
jgi:hypothetical protein